MSKRKIRMKVFNWLAGTCFLGLLQVWILLFINWVIGREIKFTAYILDGYFLFFSITLLSTFIIDHTLNDEKYIENKKVGLFIVFPSFLISASVVMHIVSKFYASQIIMERVLPIHYSIYTAALIFAFTYKVKNLILNSI